MSFEQKQYWLKGREYEREHLIKYLESELAIAKEWCKENEQWCTDNDNINNSACIKVYETLIETLKENPVATDTD